MNLVQNFALHTMAQEIPRFNRWNFRYCQIHDELLHCSMLQLHCTRCSCNNLYSAFSYSYSLYSYDFCSVQLWFLCSFYKNVDKDNSIISSCACLQCCVTADLGQGSFSHLNFVSGEKPCLITSFPWDTSRQCIWTWYTNVYHQN
jgi:hypothetical protein